jgi:hypothetical protein
MMEDKGILHTQAFTPSEALEEETHHMYPDQRSLSLAVVKRYAMQYKLGHFLPTSVISRCVLPDGRYYWVNGRRRLHAVIMAGVPMTFVVQSIHVDTFEEIAPHYAHQDEQGSRSLAERVRPFHLEEQHNLNQTKLKHLMACAPLVLAGFENTTSLHNEVRLYAHSAEVRMEFARLWCEEARQFCEDTQGARHKISANLRRAGIFGVALVTYLFAQEKATIFWHQVAHDDGLAENDARKKLHIFLGSTMTGEYRADEMAQYAASIWCAHCEGRTVSQLQPQRGKAIRLTHTPHTGKDVFRYISPQGQLLRKPQLYIPTEWQQALLAS